MELTIGTCFFCAVFRVLIKILFIRLGAATGGINLRDSV